MTAYYRVDDRGRAYVRGTDLAPVLGSRTLRARVRRGAMPVPYGRDAGSPTWGLRMAADIVHRAGKRIPADWIEALLRLRSL